MKREKLAGTLLSGYFLEGTRWLIQEGLGVQRLGIKWNELE